MVWQSSFRDIEPQTIQGSSLFVYVPNQFIREKLERRFRPIITDALERASNGILSSLMINVKIVPESEEEGFDAMSYSGAGPEVNSNSEIEPANTQHSHLRSNDLNMPRFTFEKFVCGPSNSFTHAAAMRVAEEPGEAYNPLYIYGGTGLGKTHLLGAIANYVQTHYPSKLVWLITTETFMNEFVQAIRTKNLYEFKDRYRKADVLLIDDIQFLAKKESLQSEFFYTFNALYESHNQIVITSDCPPVEIPTLEERLRSRFNMGLITDVQPPDIETRLAILEQKINEQHRKYIKHDILLYIAEQITNNIRELEGALNRVCAYAALHKQEISKMEAQEQLHDLFYTASKQPIQPKHILKVCSDFFDVAIDDIIGTSRRQQLVHARHVAMYIMRELTDLSFPAIAQIFGGRDHTTVIHAEKKIKRQLAERHDIYLRVTQLTRTVRTKYGSDRPLALPESA